MNSEFIISTTVIKERRQGFGCPVGIEAAPQFVRSMEILTCQAIANVVVTKCHQRLNEILILLTAHPGNQQSCLQENSGNMPVKLDTVLCDQHALI